MTSYATLEKPVTPDNERLHGVPHRTDTSRSLALMDEPTALTPRELEERRVIHRNDSVREQADAFR